MRQVAHLKDGTRILIRHELTGTTYRPWRWWSPADRLRHYMWTNYRGTC